MQNQRNFFKGALVLLALSVFMFVASTTAMIFSYEKLAELCICKVNFLAWSWIATAISVIAGVLNFIFPDFRNESVNNDKATRLLLMVQSLMFVAAVVLQMIFAAKITSVID